MGLIVKRYLVDKVVSAPYIEQQQKMEQDFIHEVGKLVPGINGVTIEYNGKVQDMYRDFIVRSGIAPGLNANETERPSFDNFFLWDIVCSIHSKRLFIEARSATENDFPVKRDFSFLQELDESRFLILSGRKEM